MVSGWLWEWRPEFAWRCRNDCTCFYLDVLAAYGAPELTPIYCALDDMMYDPPLSYVNWERTTTLARGGECCDFAWRRVER